VGTSEIFLFTVLHIYEAFSALTHCRIWKQ